ncbi:peptidase domain-containing ABC transporter [Azospirillum rugosum]|uniref:ATP-binding cassette subfamily B protein n=1 Tax=Azospirillum rugosum TaxID=416170 RepID=A0ABS4SNY6_9PROT|nr:peptidase domain-containing ABC transporter [Azospirillum rugosum]MBP2294271.1 ATP-binding cassette subfamily B protein [Azospirillum rugosum]MDQ0527606.1 ATP-binding cassette subfamily B protein [Azospirillum rugosum]
MQSTTSNDPQGVSPEGARTTSLHALAIVARHHGLHLSVEQMRRDYAVEAGEPNTRLLMKIAEDSGLTVRSSKLSWKHLSRLGKALPLLLRLRDGSTMVLVSFRKDGDTPAAMLQDPLSPDQACIAVDEIRLASVWDGDAIFVKRRYRVTDEERPFGFAWLIGQILREKKIFRDVGISALVLSLFALIPPLVFMVILDRVLVHQRLSTLYVLVAGIGFMLVFDTLFGFLRRHLVALGTAKVDARISTYIFDKMIGLPIDFFERTPTGVISYRLNEVWRIRGFLTGQLFGTLLDSLTLVVLIPAMFVLSAPLAFMVLGVASIMFLVVAIYIGPLARAYGKVVEAETRKGAFMIEVLHGMRTVKSLALEGRKRLDWDVRVAEAVRANTAMQFLSNQPQTILQPLEKGIYAGTLAVGAYLAIGEGAIVNGGTLVAFSMIASRATQPFVQIAALLQQFQEVRGAVAQVGKVVNQESEQGLGRQGVRPVIKGDISFSEVRFRYPGAQNPALDNTTFGIKAGQVIGIMGRSGSGKTTVTRLLQGLHQNYDGLIKIDGVDLREIDLNHLRSNLGVVLQDNFLFNGTIRENIMAAKRSASLEEVMRAARLAGAEEFIERLPRGYETVIEEGSSNLSGGQRQRIAIARALLVDPAVLILDEATSALDPDSEAIINNNLTRIAQGRTMIVISHRLASLVNCDQIIVMERGKLYDMGKHDELLQRCDVYRHLWFQQNRHLSPGSTHDRAPLTSAANS